MDASINYFDVLFVKCGVIGWVLWALSVVTVAVIVRYFVTIRRAKLIPTALAEQARALLARRQYRDAMAMTAYGRQLPGPPPGRGGRRSRPRVTRPWSGRWKRPPRARSPSSSARSSG